MISIKVSVSGGEDLAAKFAAFKPAVTAGIMGGANHVRSVIATYPADSRPTRKAVYGSTFVSEAQRIGFFKRLRSGAISVPRGRTGNLGRDWSVSALTWLSAKVGNNRDYGKWVQKPESQSLYHAFRGWQTTDQVADNEKAAVENIVKRSIDAALGSK